jgi:hypothetical protein
MADPTQDQKIQKFKSKPFRVAVEGDTTDGRVMERAWIEQMAKNYSLNTYGARIWIEHIRSYAPEGTFGAYGDVVGLSTGEVEIQGIKKLALFAQIEPTEELIQLNKKKQKIYSSIEVDPNFAKTGSAYLVGLAVTDSPASLGTEMLKFASQQTENPFNAKKQRAENLFTASNEVTLEFDPLEEPTQHVKGLFNTVLGYFSNAKKQDTANAASFADAEKAIDAIAKHSAQQTQDLGKLQQDHTALKTSHDQLQNSFNELRQKLDGTPAGAQRPLNTNSKFSDVVDC